MEINGDSEKQPEKPIQQPPQREAPKKRKWPKFVIGGASVATLVAAGYLGRDYVKEFFSRKQEPKPKVEYVDFTWEVPDGGVLSKKVAEVYFGNSNIKGIIKKVQELNPGISLDTKLSEGTPITIPVTQSIDNSQDVRYQMYPARKGETLASLVNRVVYGQVNKVADANGLSDDKRAVVTLAYADENKLDLIDFVEKKANYGPKDLVIVNMPDGIKGDYLKPGQKIVFPSVKKVIKAEAEQKSLPTKPKVLFRKAGYDVNNPLSHSKLEPLTEYNNLERLANNQRLLGTVSNKSSSDHSIMEAYRRMAPVYFG